MPHYNVMGVAKASLEASTRYLAYDLGAKKIRVNCISAGPVNTLAARGISGFSSMMKHYQERAPLQRSCDPAEIGQTGLFLASDGGGGDHRADDLRRRRLSNYGHVASPAASLTNAAEQVHMQMRHAFAGIGAAVDDDAIAALLDPEVARDLRRGRDQFA